jgi:hypothetical protein
MTIYARFFGRYGVLNDWTEKVKFQATGGPRRKATWGTVVKGAST